MGKARFFKVIIKGTPHPKGLQIEELSTKPAGHTGSIGSR